MTRSEANAIRASMEQTFSLASGSMTADEIIRSRVLCPAWEPGSHSVGDVYSAGDQIWQCIQSYDNAVYPDIAPGAAAWRTFHKPYHGTTKETALPWVEPTGAHDMYLAGEYMIWTDGTVYRCVTGTAYNPDVYAPAWEAAA